MSHTKPFIQNKSFIKSLVFTLLILFGLRFFYSVPVPGVNAEYFKELISKNTALGFMDILSGSGLSNISVMMLNITPYISASIIIQLLGNVFKKIRDMQKGMHDERKKLERITILLGIILGALEGVAIAIGYGQKGLFTNYTWYWVAIAVATWCVGIAVSSFLGKLIQDRFNMNGISLILVFNILASYLSDGKILYDRFIPKKAFWMQIIIGICILLCIFALFAFTYFVQASEKHITIQHAAKNNFMKKTQSSTFPIKLCPGSVVPIIFASSVMTTPVLIASAFTTQTPLWAKILSSNYWFVRGDWLPTVGVIIYIGLIYGFSFFYANMTLDAKEIAENFKKSGSMIPGIRPGRPTEDYLRVRIRNTVSVGAIAIIIIALIPIILSGLFGLQRISFLGTSVLIVVGVLVELKSILESKSKQGQYVISSTEGGLF